MSACPNCGFDAPGIYCQQCSARKTGGGAQAVATSIDGGAVVRYTPDVRSPTVRPSAAPDQVRGGFGTYDPTASVPIGALDSRLRDFAPGQVGAGAAVRLAMSDEEAHWSGAPSPYLILEPALKMGALVVVCAAIAAALRAPWLVGVAVVGASVRLALRHFELRSIRYRISSQRLEITEGLWKQDTRALELHELQPGTISSPILLRLCGLANLHVVNGYGDHTLLGLPQNTARLVRDMLRESSQIEGGRLDKLRFR